MKLLLKGTFFILLFGMLLFCSCNKEGLSWNLSRNNPNDSLVNGEIQITKHSLTFWYTTSDYDYYSLKSYMKNYDDKVIENVSYNITTTFISTFNINIGGSELGNIGNISPYEEKLIFNKDSPYDMTSYIRVLKGGDIPSNIPFNVKITYEVKGKQYTKSFQIST